MDAVYTDTGLGNAQYRIVERYSDWDKYPDVHSYFFAITNTGETIVFHSPTTNGGIMYLKPTENTEIQAEFKTLGGRRIINHNGEFGLSQALFLIYDFKSKSLTDVNI